LRKIVDQGRPTVVERIEIDGLIIQGTILPTPREETDPLKCQSAHGCLVHFPLIALLLVRNPRPEGRPDRFGGPLDACVPEERGTLEAPVPPGFRAGACGDWRAPRLFLPCGGGGRAFPLFAEGDEPSRGEAGSCPWECLAQGESRMA